MYLAWLCIGACARGWQPWVVSFSDELASDAGQRFRAEVPPAVRIVEVARARPRAAASLRVNIQEYADLIDGVAKRIPDGALLFFPDGDAALPTMAMRRHGVQGRRWAAILMRMAFHHDAVGIAAKRRWRDRLWPPLLARLISQKTLTSLFTIDPSFVHYVPRWRHRQWRSKFRYLPDPITLPPGERPRGRRSFGLDDASVVLLLFGALSERKGVAELIDGVTWLASMAKAQGASPSLKILIAGRSDAAIAKLLQSDKARRLIVDGVIVHIDRWLSETDMADAFAASDICWLGYKAHEHMSGVLVAAGVAGLPVVATTDGVVGWLVKKHQLGLAIADLSPPTIAAALERLVADTAFRSAAGSHGRAIFATHTIATAQAIIFDRLEADG